MVAGVVPQCGCVIVGSDLDDDLILIITENLEVFLSHRRDPHIGELVASAFVNMIRDDELSCGAIGKLKLQLEPVKLSLGDITLKGLIVVYQIIHRVKHEYRDRR